MPSVGAFVEAALAMHMLGTALQALSGIEHSGTMMAWVWDTCERLYDTATVVPVPAGDEFASSTHFSYSYTQSASSNTLGRSLQKSAYTKW